MCPAPDGVGLLETRGHLSAPHVFSRHSAPIQPARQLGLSAYGPSRAVRQASGSRRRSAARQLMGKITPLRAVLRCACNAPYERMFDALWDVRDARARRGG
jgi:hypothetical protein